MDNGGSRFAIGLLVLWGAFLLLFIALHPNGIPGANNPKDALQWLIGEFQTVSGLSASQAAANAITNPGLSPQNQGAAPTETGA